MTATLEDVTSKSFDYVIIGGGTAGLTLAARLTEDPKTAVLVLEAGQANVDEPNILRPFSFGSHFGNDLYSWSYLTSKQGFASDTQKPWFRGKGLGGSSGINFLSYVKPPAEDINDIERLGNPGWNWEHYNRLLQKVEGFVPPTQNALSKAGLKAGVWNIGTQGPLKIALPGTINVIESKVQETWANLGLPPAPDPYGGNPSGSFISPSTYDPLTHTRSYSTTAFYLPHKDRTNLTVLVSAYVNRIITETSTGSVGLTATGVEFVYKGEKHNVYASKEVILSAGALKSSHILELSGIGDRKLLEKIGVPLKVDLPGVGENIQEHGWTGVSFELKDDVEFDNLDLARNPDMFAKHLELHRSGSGIFTQSVVGLAYTSLDTFSAKATEIYKAANDSIRSKMESLSPGVQDLRRIQLARLERQAPGCEFISWPSTLPTPNFPKPGKTYISILTCMNHGFSRGTVHATSNNPSKDPEYDPRYFEDDIDLQTLVESVRFIRKMAITAPFKDLIVAEHNPGPAIDTDGELRDYIKKTFASLFHSIGSCSMLPRDKGGVVDTNLKVYGTTNLRVVDLSVIPIHFAAHSQATAYAIAEHAAEVIKGERVF